MHHRFSSPHPAGGHMHMQQQHQQMVQQQQQQQVPGLVQLPNGLIVLPNGQQVTPQQTQALIASGALQMPNNMNMMPMNTGMPMNVGMPMHGGMMPMQGGMPTNPGRFGNQNQTLSGHLTGTASSEMDMMSDTRFQSFNTNTGTQAVEQQVETQDTPSVFSIDVSKGVKFAGNTKVILSSFYDEIKPNQIFTLKDKLTLTDCFEEAVESAIDHAHDEGINKLMVIGNYLVENSFYKSFEQAKFNELILDNDVKAIYKAMKALWPTLTSKYDIHLLDSFDTIMTAAINDFIGINSPVPVNIDSFMTDFNELLKFLRNLEDTDEDLEDELINYLNAFVEDTKGGLDSLKQLDQQEGKAVTYVPELYTIAYVDKYSHELGIVNAPSALTMIEDNLINKFLISAAEFMFEAQKITVCYMVTIDKYVIQLSRNLKGQIFIKKM